jgi:hypothetical protein
MRRAWLLVRRDVGIKIVSVGLAALVWYSAGDKQQFEYNVRVPLEVRNLPDGLIFLSEPPRSVRVRVRGSGRFLKFRLKDLSAIIDASEAAPGLFLRPITIDDVVVPVGMDAEAREVQEPRMLRVEIAPALRRRVPVEPVLAGNPPEGFAVVGSPALSPAHVEVVGPERMLAPMKSVRLEDVVLSRARAPLSVIRRVALPDTFAVKATPQEIEVRVAIERLTEARFDAVPVRLSPGDARLRGDVTPDAVAVRLSGPASLVAALRADSLALLIDGAGIEAGTYDYRTDIVGANRVLLLPTAEAPARPGREPAAHRSAHLAAPPEIRVLEILPSHFSVVVERAATRRREPR